MLGVWGKNKATKKPSPAPQQKPNLAAAQGQSKLAQAVQKKGLNLTNKKK